MIYDYGSSSEEDFLQAPSNFVENSVKLSRPVGQHGMAGRSAFDMSAHMEKNQCFFTSLGCVNFIHWIFHWNC